MNFKKIIATSFLFISAVTMSSCGNANSDNLETLLNGDMFPQLNTFASGGAFNTGQAFTQNNPYWLFSGTGFSSYLAPARGVVAEIGQSDIPGLSATNYVTIIHSSRISSRVHGISIVNVRAGDTVALSQSVGVFNASLQIAFQVLLDGVPVCPLSFVSPDLARNVMNNPCR